MPTFSVELRGPSSYDVSLIGANFTSNEASYTTNYNTLPDITADAIHVHALGE